MSGQHASKLNGNELLIVRKMYFDMFVICIIVFTTSLQKQNMVFLADALKYESNCSSSLTFTNGSPPVM